MAEITKENVVDLREKTGAGLIDCKRALVESDGDVEEAVAILRKKGVATAAKKAGREAGEGVIACKVGTDGRSGVIVEVNCETDFVAKNEDFQVFANEIAGALLTDPNSDLEDKRTEQVAKIGENIRISRSDSFSMENFGRVESYVHTGGKVGVLLALSTESEVGAKHEETCTLAKDLCMQVAATAPVCINRGDVPEVIVAKEREIATAQAEGKPPQAVEKIIAGKLEKFYATSCLEEQSFVKNPDLTIKDFLTEKCKIVGEALSITKFTRLQIGETG